ncbi:MAG: hypothetical protein RSJ41_02560 [Clostridia bacterium]
MSWLDVDFLYMPGGSFTVLPDKTLLFKKDVPEDLKQRMLAEWPEYVKRIEEKHAAGRTDSSDMV